jgi:hypothetical protein
MLITMPFDSEAELKRLLPLGGDEFYCGVLQPGSRPNVRSAFSPANLKDFRELAACARLAGENHKRVFVCFNTYTLERAEEGIFQALEAGAHGIILADHTLVPAVRERCPSCKIIISTLNPTFNSQALRFLRGLGADRVVLERHLTLTEIDGLSRTAAGIGLELEAFVLNSACRFVNGSCSLHRSLLADESGRWPGAALSLLPNWQPCSEPVGLTVTDAAGGEPAFDSGFSLDGGLGHYCGLCALFRLHLSGLTAVKVVGRGYPTAKKLLDLELLVRYIDMIRRGAVDEGNFIATGRRLYSETYGRSCGELECHYCELREKRKGADL